MKNVRMSDDGERTLGRFWTDEGLPVCLVLELPWRDNARDVSCIPAGVYECRWLWSEKHGRSLYHVCDVPGRGNVEIHIGNTVIDTEGCLLCGETRGKLKCRDGIVRDAVLGSHGAFDAFNRAAGAPNTFTLTIVSAPGRMVAEANPVEIL